MNSATFSAADPVTTNTSQLPAAVVAFSTTPELRSASWRLHDQRIKPARRATNGARCDRTRHDGLAIGRRFFECDAGDALQFAHRAFERDAEAAAPGVRQFPRYRSAAGARFRHRSPPGPASRTRRPWSDLSSRDGLRPWRASLLLRCRQIPECRSIAAPAAAATVHAARAVARNRRGRGTPRRWSRVQAPA